MNRGYEVGNYTIGRTLGTGTTGKVKIATDKETGKQVAVKIIKKSQFDLKPELEGKIHREIALMQILDHPHLLNLYEVCESSHHLYIFIEYAQHGELFDYLVKKRFLEPAEALMFFREIIFGLEFLHSHCICHRDLKPENILLDEYNHIKIADFGFARWMKSNIAETSCGSPHYAAPEVIRGLPYDGRGADIWSCGVILYALLAGRLPFDEDSIRSLLHKIKLGQYKMLQFPSEIQDLISKILVVDVNKRITLEEIKKHPAFLYGLCPTYILPSPLPIIQINESFKNKSIEPKFFNFLKAIGYNSDEEITNELLCNEHTNAKMFYFMFLKNSYLDELPWEKSEDNITAIDQDMYIMPAKQFGGLLQKTNDPFLRKQQIGSLGSYSTSYSPNSLIYQPEWAENISSSLITDVEQCFTNINLSPDKLMGFLQRILTKLEIRWFHPNDLMIISKHIESDSLMTFTAMYEEGDTLTLSIVLVHGDKFFFDQFIKDLSESLKEEFI